VAVASGVQCVRGWNGLGLAAVIPTYQREATIVRAVEGVLGQTRAPSEVIVVDDGSTDGTRERLRQFGDSIRVIAQPQSGSAAARNRGVEEASADWVAFLDSDDRWEPDHLERMAQAIVTTSGRADLYFDDTEVAFEMFDRSERRVHVGSLWELAGFRRTDAVTLVEDGSPWVLSPVQPMMVQSTVVRRARYLEVGGMWPMLRLRHDTHLFFKLGLGRPVCAVTGVGATMTDDAAEDRLTRDVTPLSPSYWEETVLLYDDLGKRSGSRGTARREFDERLATAHWRLARIALAQGSRRSAFMPLLRCCRARPLFVPRKLFTRLVAGNRGK
jgi:glycosyltransferase involved in cell wall biosynthesis